MSLGQNFLSLRRARQAVHGNLPMANFDSAGRTSFLGIGATGSIGYEFGYITPCSGEKSMRGDE
jgi:hypothetical protein